MAEPNLRKALSLVTKMMAIPGKSGKEGRVARFIKDRLREESVPSAYIHSDAAHRRTPVQGDSGNVFCKLPGKRRGPRRLLMAHMDTVPICVGSKPVRRRGMMVSADSGRGLGADDRAGAAVVLHTALEIVRQRIPHPPLTFCWTVQEEIGLHGARLLNHGLLGRPKLAYNWDGGAPDKLTIGATGGYRTRIIVHGIASHAGGAPEMGVSAIAVAALAISNLVARGWHGDIHKGNHHGTSNVGYIYGGEASNVVTDYVELKAEARSHDPEFRRRILKEIESAFYTASKQIKNVAGECGYVEFDGRLDYESFRLSPDDPSTITAEQAIRDIGRTPTRSVCNGGVDANWMMARGIPTVTLGCGQLNQHTLSEALDITGFRDACRIALRLATEVNT